MAAKLRRTGFRVAGRRWPYGVTFAVLCCMIVVLTLCLDATAQAAPIQLILGLPHEAPAPAPAPAPALRQRPATKGTLGSLLLPAAAAAAAPLLPHPNSPAPRPLPAAAHSQPQPESDMKGLHGGPSPLTSTMQTLTANQATDSIDPAPEPEAGTPAELLSHVVIDRAKRKKIPPFTLIADLPAKYVPKCPPHSPTEDAGKRNQRLVIVGDVHGNLDALRAVLRKVGFNKKYGDHLILAGDLVTKGPDSRGVVELAMQLGASAVRGNHEDNVLRAAMRLGRLLSPTSDADRHIEEEYNGLDNEGDSEVLSKTERNARAVARSLSRTQLAWVSSLPIILRVGHIQDAPTAPWNAGTIVVVHGGLVPLVPLEKQDPWAVMNMRTLVFARHGKKKNRKGHKAAESIDEEQSENLDENSEAQLADIINQLKTLDPSFDTEDQTTILNRPIPVDTRKGQPWSRVWNRVQNHLAKPESRTLVVYGHDAKRGLQANPEVDISPSSLLASSDDEEEDDGEEVDIDGKGRNKKRKKIKGIRYAYGIDSGCGNGQKLSALVIEGTADAGVKHWIEQVDCSVP